VDPQTDKLGKDHASPIASAQSPVFAGPTSSNFSLGMAKMILEHNSGGETAHSDFDPALAGSASCWEEEDEEDQQEDQYQGTMAAHSSQVYGLQLHDALRLLQVYHECVGVLHPIVDVEALVQQCKMLWHSANDLPVSQTSPLRKPEDDSHLKMVLAIALLAEEGGSNATATRIHADLQPLIANQMLARSFTLAGQVRLLLAVGTHRPFKCCSLTTARRSTMCSRTTIAWLRGTLQ
jgi:hypothetical protein